MMTGAWLRQPFSFYSDTLGFFFVDFKLSYIANYFASLKILIFGHAQGCL